MSIWKGFWFGGSVAAPGIKLVGGYILNTGTTMDLNYELRYYVIDDSGDRHPSTGYEVQPFSYSYGQNDVTITSGALSADVTINTAETFSITSTSGFSFIVNPELSATLSGGAWSADVPDQLINTDYTLVNLEDNIDFQGDNTVIYTLTDPNADTFSADNTIVLRYTPDIYIVGVDSNTDVTNPVETSEYQVDLTYVLGGVFTTSAGLEWTGGTSATEPAVSLQPGDNELIVGPYPDDFGNTESSFAQLVTKVPSLNYVGLTTIDQETYGTSYTATSGLEIDVDVGAPYATAVDETFIFTSGDYRSYEFDLSYGYPSQPSASATTLVSINYVMDASLLPQSGNIVQNVEGIGDIINILTYDPANGFIFAESVVGTSVSANVFVDQGFDSATSFNYDMIFNTGDYRDYTFDIPYTNPITSAIFNTEVTVAFKAVSTYEDFASNLIQFGDPTNGIPSDTTIIDDGGTDKFSSVGDVKELTYAVQATPALMPLVTTNVQGINAGQYVVQSEIWMQKPFTGTEAYYLTEHAIIVHLQIPTARGASGQQPVIKINGVDVFRFDDFSTGFRLLLLTGIAGSSTVHAKSSHATIIVTHNAVGDLVLYSSQGEEITSVAFGGWTNGPLSIGVPGSANETTDAIHYEFSAINYTPDLAQRSEIYARCVEKWETV
jgi:hypothetical protein